MLVCNRCGKENQDNYKFCLGCGSDLTVLRAAAAQNPAPAAPAAVASPGGGDAGAPRLHDPTLGIGPSSSPQRGEGYPSVPRSNPNLAPVISGLSTTGGGSSVPAQRATMV